MCETIAKYPEAPAIDDGTVQLTYRALGSRVNALARRLWALDIGAGDRVGVRMQSGSSDLYIAILGVMACGAAYVPVDIEEPEERMETAWSEAGVCAVVGGHLAVTLVPGRRAQGRHREPHPEDDAWIIFTSGSTGKPKGVVVTHRSAAAWADAEAEMYCQDNPLGPGDRVLAGLSVAFDASCEEMWLAWRNGACLVPAPRTVVRSGADLGSWLVQRHITAISTVPTLAALWPVDALDGIRLLIVGGEACPGPLMDRLAGSRREVWNTYGPTEATVISCGAMHDGTEPNRIGLPLPGWDLAVVDTDGIPVRWGEEGELVIGGVGLGRYLDPTEDAAKYAPMAVLGWSRAYRSGDLVLADPRGLVFRGRADDQVKLAGRRVELGEIDAALTSLPNVAAAASAVRTTSSGNRVLAGYLVQATGTRIDLAAARTRLTEVLPAQLVPALGVVQSLPIKASGKVDRKALPWPLPGGLPADSAHELTGTSAWLAEQWNSVLGPTPLTRDSNFFALGGGSVAAAQLISLVRTRHPEASIADLYAIPSLGPMADHLDSLGAPFGDERETMSIPPWTGLLQLPLILGLYYVNGLKYLTGLAVASLLVRMAGAPWAPNPPLLPTLVACLVLFSFPSRLIIAAGCARLLMHGIRPGIFPRGGLVHLRLWATERIVAYCALDSLMGTPFAAWYARALGCDIGKGVHLDAMPPVTGMAAIGSNASIERGVDMAGYWIDGNVLSIGSIDIGSNATVGARSTLLPGTHIGIGAEVAPGTCVNGFVPDGQLWTGSPMRHVGAAGKGWPVTQAPEHRRAAVRFLYPLSLVGLGPMMALSALPAELLIFMASRSSGDVENTLQTVALWTPLAVIFTSMTHLLITAGLVRLLSHLIAPGLHLSTGPAAWAAWLTDLLLTKALISAYAIYASLFTPGWMRLLGAQVGKRVEISTVETMPHLTIFLDRSFLADRSLVTFKRVRAGWLQLGHASVGEESFLGNSAVVGPGRHIPDKSLIAALSSAPSHMPEGTSWFGLPPVELTRLVDHSDRSRTYSPPPRLLAARAAVEACRIVPSIIKAWLGLVALYVLASTYVHSGLMTTILVSGPTVLGTAVASCLVALTAKWGLVGRFRPSEHPLWSSFVWRNELADVFTESLAGTELIGMSVGTPIINLWLRCMGTKIGRRVWCETRWLPEFDLITLGDGVTINRGCVLQTHLFHDRIMRMDEIDMGINSTLGPNSIALPGSSLGTRATVGAASLVMRSEAVPADSRWAGNPLRTWVQSHPAQSDEVD
ncbi:Pls/PosA family non-ribosomal peptide synthetase [Arthrobacter sp. AZCC_0090]|uniref:Pls/PosA family non-ribosomal peptide synthetase n=1 Tax=Arthrobacter sp. AZCC_0090 TaxID=2735881 RepID=UPI00185DCBC5|nr:Pls/PosA family non-ribosomal peptide synthetase [Arthrobacter sp. AZCC_0090]MBB6404122.1 non-ribosomal peptide synthetase-like protein [Arthrobacter sp. AZCC_0090]